MRGKVAIPPVKAISARITPAYAGKRINYEGTVSQWKDHPRLCGEKHWRFHSRHASQRITPAYAGKSTKLQILR